MGGSAVVEAVLPTKEWRERERWALSMTPHGPPGAARLVGQYAEETNAQVKQAILVSLEQILSYTPLPAKMANTLLKEMPKIKPGAGEPPTAALQSRVVCLAERIRRSKRKGAGK